MKFRWLSLVFGVMFFNGNYWNFGRSYLEVEKLGIIFDSFIRLGGKLEFRDLKDREFWESIRFLVGVRLN